MLADLGSLLIYEKRMESLPWVDVLFPVSWPPNLASLIQKVEIIPASQPQAKSYFSLSPSSGQHRGPSDDCDGPLVSGPSPSYSLPSKGIFNVMFLRLGLALLPRLGLKLLGSAIFLPSSWDCRRMPLGPVFPTFLSSWFTPLPWMGIPDHLNHGIFSH